MIIKIDKKIVGWKIPGKEEKSQKEDSNQDKRPNRIIPSSAPKRPKELPADIHFITYKGQKWIALVGLLEGAPYELFAGYSSTLQLPSKLTKGRIIKSTKGIYDLYVDINGEDLIIKNIIKTLDNAEHCWATRLISLPLRHGAPIKYTAEQLSKDGGIGDINKVLSRVLKKYVKDDVATEGDKCEKCGSVNVFYNSGCKDCKDCLFSKCG